jgi:hypothetical protein
MKEIIDRLLEAPDSQLDAALKSDIRKWTDPPTALQVLETLDRCIHGSLASGFMVTVLQVLYDMRCKAEGVAHEQLVPFATWRKENGVQ